MLDACLTSCGSVFQILGPYTLNDLAAKVDFLTNGMINLSLLFPLRSYFVVLHGRVSSCDIPVLVLLGNYKLYIEF